jgi:hypothetical protein
MKLNARQRRALAMLIRDQIIATAGNPELFWFRSGYNPEGPADATTLAYKLVELAVESDEILQRLVETIRTCYPDHSIELDKILAQSSEGAENI